MTDPKDTKKVLDLNLETISDADLKWLHDLKNKAAAMTGRLQLKHLKEEIQKGAYSND